MHGTFQTWDWLYRLRTGDQWPLRTDNRSVIRYRPHYRLFLVSVGSLPLFSCCGCEADGVCWKKMVKCTKSACDQPTWISKLTRRREGNILRSLRPQLLLALSEKSLHSPTCQTCDNHVLLAVCWGGKRMEKDQYVC